MKAVVTGGAGFVGSHLTERLANGGVEVVCIERPKASTMQLNGTHVDFHDCGLNDEDELRKCLRGADVVFHLGALTQARTSEDFYRVNTDGTAAVLRAASRQESPPLFVFASSLAALGPCSGNGDLTDRSIPHPLSHYGNSKLLAEAVVHAYADDVPSVIFRLSTVYGPREMAVLKLFRMIKYGLALTVGPWSRQVSMLYVVDLVEAFVRSAEMPQAVVGQTLLLAHPVPTTWEQFALTIGSVLNRKPRLLSIPIPVANGIAVSAEVAAHLQGSAAILNRERVREISQDRWVCDVSKTINTLGYMPAWPVERGVAATADWYRHAGWI